MWWRHHILTTVTKIISQIPIISNFLQNQRSTRWRPKEGFCGKLKIQVYKVKTTAQSLLSCTFVTLISKRLIYIIYIRFLLLTVWKAWGWYPNRLKYDRKASNAMPFLLNILQKCGYYYQRVDQTGFNERKLFRIVDILLRRSSDVLILGQNSTSEKQQSLCVNTSIMMLS